MSSIIELQEMICNAHVAHYNNKSTGLIDANASPNANIIYHFYSNGEVTYQKGGWEYLQRSEFTLMPSLSRKLSILSLPRKIDGNLTYAILTEDECKKYREIMHNLYTKEGSL